MTGEEDDHSWPGARPMHRPRAKLVPSKSSMKSASPAGASIKSAASKSRFHSHSSREGLRFSLTPNHHSPAAAAAAGGMLHEDSMGSDHSTLSASFKSFRSIPSRLSQFGTSYSLRWSVTAVQSDEFWAYCKRRFLTTAMVLAYFLYPDMSENIANIFSCYPVEIGTYSDASTGSVSLLSCHHLCPAPMLQPPQAGPVEQVWMCLKNALPCPALLCSAILDLFLPFLCCLGQPCYCSVLPCLTLLSPALPCPALLVLPWSQPMSPCVPFDR